MQNGEKSFAQFLFFAVPAFAIVGCYAGSVGAGLAMMAAIYVVFTFCQKLDQPPESPPPASPKKER